MTSEDIALASSVLSGLFAQADIEVSIEPEQLHTGEWVFNLQTTFPQTLIGKQGSTLQAFQTVALAMVNKQLQDRRVHFTLDVDDYRRKREWFLKQTARAAVEQAKFSGKEIKLEPMPHYERRLVHAYVQETFPEVSSESDGKEPYRSIVIRPR